LSVAKKDERLIFWARTAPANAETSSPNQVNCANEPCKTESRGFQSAVCINPRLFAADQRTLTMPQAPLVTYIRVSTSGQGRSGLGIEAQRHALAQFAQGERRTHPAHVTADLSSSDVPRSCGRYRRSSPRHHAAQALPEYKAGLDLAIERAGSSCTSLAPMSGSCTQRPSRNRMLPGSKFPVPPAALCLNWALKSQLILT
jgi:hypothetical protein